MTFLIILLVFCILLLLGAIYIANKTYHHEEVCTALAVIAGIGILAFVIIIPCWYSAEIRARSLNKYFGISFTTSEVFWSPAVIEKYLETEATIKGKIDRKELKVDLDNVKIEIENKGSE